RRRPPRDRRRDEIRRSQRGRARAAAGRTAARGQAQAGMTGPVLIRLRLRARFSDCDSLGHVHNAGYLAYLEEGRLAPRPAQIGAWNRDGESGNRGEGFILARAEIDFRAQVRFGDELEVRLALAGFGRTSATYDYEIVDVTSERTVATAKTVQVWFDYDAKKPTPLTDETKRKLSEPV